MRAARFHGAKDIRIEEVPEPELRPGAVAIDIAWNGICGSDLHEYVDGPHVIPAEGHPQPVTGETVPVTLGHEFSGTVAEIGEGVEGFAVGDRVVVEPWILPDDVDPSQPGEYQLRPEANFVGLGGRGGGLSERVVADAKWVHGVGDMPLDHAAMIEPLAVAHHAVRRSGVRPGQTALVGGAGPIGVLAAAVLHAEGVTVIVSEVADARKEKARTSGVADHVVDPTEEDLVERVQALTGGRGADVAIECTGVQQVLDALIAGVKPLGTVVNVAIWGKPASVDVNTLSMKEVTMTGSLAYAHDHETVIDLVNSGKVDLAPFITSRIALEDVVEQGFEKLVNGAPGEVKILVHP